MADALHFLPESEQVSLPDDTPREASLAGPGYHGVSDSLAEAVAVAGEQIGRHFNSRSIILNGRPTTHAAMDEYVAASELSRMTHNSGESTGGGTRNLWHENAGGEPPSIHPTGPSVPVDRYIVGGAPDVAGRRMSTEIVPGSVDTETLVRHANRARATFPPGRGSTQGTWKEKGNVEIDVSDVSPDPDQARDRMLDRHEKALFWPHMLRPDDDQWGEVRTDRRYTSGVSNRDVGPQFKERLTRGKP